MFIDASAVVAVIAKESEYLIFRNKIELARDVLLSPLTIYEAVLALTRLTQNQFAESRLTMKDFMSFTKAQIIPIDPAIGDMALDAFARFGKGRHRAGLNMGDCFSYACAKVHRVPLLCKGDDFIHTDIELA